MANPTSYDSISASSDSSSTSLLLVGNSSLAIALRGELVARGIVVQPIEGRNICNSADLLVLALDTTDIGELAYWEKVAWTNDIPFLSVHINECEAVIGPLTRRSTPGCLLCWISRYFSGQRYALSFAEAVATKNACRPSGAWSAPLVVKAVACLAAEVVARQIPLPALSQSRPFLYAYYWDLQSFTGQYATLLPDPLCPQCGILPADTAEVATISLQARPKPTETADRLQDATAIPDLQALYVGRRAGIVPSTSTNWRFRSGAVVTVVTPLGGNVDPEPCSGFCDRYTAAHNTAILEGLERYASSSPRGKRISVFGTVADLQDHAVNPRLFGLHSSSEYQNNPHLLTPYDDTLNISFVWAHSFGRDRAVLVPRQLAYYPLGISHEPLFALESSNGCVLATCVEEAILHGLFEVLERDAFLLTWYAQCRPPRFDPMSTGDPETRFRCRALDLQGYDVIAFDITTNWNIPAVWLMAVNRLPRLPYAFCIGAAHLRPERALKKACRELTSVVERWQSELSREEHRLHVAMLHEDAGRVNTMFDHALYYCSPEARHDLAFLLNGQRKTTLREMEARSNHLWSSDLKEELEKVIQALVDKGSDVIAVNQTAQEQLYAGLCTYKVLVPGAISITWGQFRRLEGIPRLIDVLRREHQEFATVPLPNPSPHPFP